MSLIATIKAAVATAWGALGDLPQTAIIRSDYLGTYNPATDATVASWGSERSVSVIKWDEIEKGEPNTPTGVRKSLIFQAVEVDFPPSDKSQVEVGGELYKVEMATLDPAGATWELIVYQ